MKNIMNKPIKLILIILLTFIFSCASTEQTRKEPTVVQKVIFKTYQISAPYIGKWESETKEDEESMNFINKYTTVVPLASCAKQIRVFKIPISKEAQYMNEEMLATGFRDQEWKILVEQFKKKIRGPFLTHTDVFIVNYDATTVGNKKLYYMQYEISFIDTGGHHLQQAILYLYVPEDFKDRQAFYGFLYTDLYKLGNLKKIDLEPIHWVINSFQLK